MKRLTEILLILLVVISSNACNTSQSNETTEANNKTSDTSLIVVYYFHNSRRCATCEAVENVTKSALETLYPEMIEKGQLVFKTISIEERTNKNLIKKYKVSGQTLLLTSGSKSDNLTNKAFMYAENKPDKLIIALKESIDSFIN